MSIRNCHGINWILDTIPMVMVQNVNNSTTMHNDEHGVPCIIIQNIYIFINRLIKCFQMKNLRLVIKMVNGYAQ